MPKFKPTKLTNEQFMELIQYNKISCIYCKDNEFAGQITHSKSGLLVLLDQANILNHYLENNNEQLAKDMVSLPSQEASKKIINSYMG